jgi:hypothetical protein
MALLFDDFEVEEGIYFPSQLLLNRHGFFEWVLIT